MVYTVNKKDSATKMMFPLFLYKNIFILCHLSEIWSLN